MCAGAGCKNGSNKLPSHGMMSHNEELPADRISVLLFSLRWYMEFYLAEPDTVLVFGIYLGVLEMEPALQCRRQYVCRTHRH